MNIITTIFFALLGGILPAVIWLFFWLKEDGTHPEPNKLLIKAFFYGMIAVPISFLLEQVVNIFLLGGSLDPTSAIQNSFYAGIFTLILWALIEEGTKYFAAYKSGLSNRSNDEPLDPVIYLITAALGFAALENTFFIFTPLMDGSFSNAILTSNLRFVGATLLHVTSSAIIGIFIAFSYFKSKTIKNIYLITGIIVSVALHSIFNFFIISFGEFTLIIFGIVWILIITLILIFEKIKNIHLNSI